MSKEGDQLQTEVHVDTKATADAARAKVRDTHASRDARKRCDPEVAAVVDEVCGAMDDAKQPEPRNKGGRRKGSKNRSPVAIARDSILRVINKKGQVWLESLADKTPYLFVQLMKSVLPRTAPDVEPFPEQHTIRLHYVAPPLPVEDRIPPGGAKLEIETVNVTKEQYEQLAPGAIAAASRSPGDSSAPDPKSPSTDTKATPATPGYDAQLLTTEAVIDAARHGKPSPERHKLRTLIIEAAAKFNANLHTKYVRQAVELKRLRGERSHDSRMRMYAEDAGQEEGWSGGGGGW